jgi:DNA-binding NarL/FixJ family response regulator
MAREARGDTSAVIARAGELGAIERFVAASAERSAVLVLEGEPGIGKTTLWEAGIGAARQRQLRILAARASDAEAQLAFAGLTDLLEDVDDGELAALPVPQRLALEVALLRAVPPGARPEPLAIALGLLKVLRALAGLGPLLVAVDDLQWQDSASTDALAFAARRLDGEAVSFLLARRPGMPSDLERELERRGLERIQVGPLGLTATGRLLLERLGLNVRRQLLRRIVEATRGNPFFALEIGRTLAEHGPPATGEALPVPDVVEDLLGSRVDRLPRPVWRLLLAVALSGDLHPSQLAALGDADTVDHAVEAGLLVVQKDHVRAADPLLAAAAKERSSAGERRELHVELARVVADEELRAFHLALATDDPDEELAATVAAASAAAAARGAAQEAVVLAEHALRLTADPEERNRRLLALADYLNVAGEQVRLTELLAPRLESLPPGEARAKACLLLSNGSVAGNDDVVRYLERALAESARDARLRAIALSELAANDAVARVEGIRHAEERALEALETGRGAGPEVERAALYALAWARSLRGRAIADLCERFGDVSDAGAYLAFSPDRIAAQRLVWRGDVVEARATLAGLLTVADERGEPISYALQRLHLCELELRTGGWDEAERMLDEWSRDGELLLWACYDRCRALLAAGRGLPEEAQRWAAEAMARAERTGIHWDVLEALRARGIGALLARDLTLAEESLGAVWEHVQREGVEEPGAFPVAPDLVETLAELGKLDEAQAVTDRLRRLSEACHHPWGLATTKRCAALVQLASRGDPEEAATCLAAAADAYGALGLRFDRARSLLSLGRAQRRLKQWGAARGWLDQAVAELDELGSPGWAHQARSERARVGGRPPQARGELTPAERRVVELAADGLSNKEIASSLVVTVRTVEVHLTHAYAKLGIRSRTQLARRLSESP